VCDTAVLPQAKQTIPAILRKTQFHSRSIANYWQYWFVRITKVFHGYTYGGIPVIPITVQIS